MNKLNICGFSLLCSSMLSLPLWAADPTAPEAVLSAGTDAKAEAQQIPKLSLIRQEGKERLAILDGQPRRVGAMHGSYKVISIGAGRVILAQGQRQLTLQLFPSMTK
ncbi:MAG: hypothetical protein E6Q75_02420 [Rheinheimera sp.]|nr:MAG: hypothetical protein E6Q75_02420 [Rheinheimera sp.]